MGRPRKYAKQEDAKRAKLTQTRASRQRSNPRPRQGDMHDLQFVIYDPHPQGVPIATRKELGLRTDLEIPIGDRAVPPPVQQGVIISERSEPTAVPIPISYPVQYIEEEEEEEEEEEVDNEYEAAIKAHVEKLEIEEADGIFPIS